MWLKSFASEIIGHVLNGNTPDYLAVHNIKKKCTTDLKNLDVSGIEITQEAAYIESNSGGFRCQSIKS
jgi:hypothetical protein